MAAMISTRGRYALRVMTDLAQQAPGSLVPLKDIAERLALSQKYLEAIMTGLSKGGLVTGVHGKGGGYRLVKCPADYSLGEILRVTEGSLAPVGCLDAGCTSQTPCPALPVWEKLERLVEDYLDSVRLQDILPPEKDR